MFILTLNSPVPASVAVPMRLIDETSALEGMLCHRRLWTQRLGQFWPRLQLRWISMGWGEHHRPLRSPPSGGGGSNIISTDFDNGSNSNNTIGGSSPTPVEFEATTAGGDSGGPVLVQLGGEWVIAGVSLEEQLQQHPWRHLVVDWNRDLP